MAFLSKKLATIDTSIDLSKITSEDMVCHGTYEEYFSSEFLEFLEGFEFRSLIPEGMQKKQDVSLEYQSHEIVSEDELSDLFKHMSSSKDVAIRTS